MTASVHVTAAPLLDPGHGRADLDVIAGLTLAQIVSLAVPGYPGLPCGLLRVTLVTPAGVTPVAEALWHRVRPHGGVHVVIRAVPGKDGLRSILLAVVSVAAIALAPAVGGLLGITSSFGLSLVGAGLTVVGTLLVNALIPVQTPRSEARRRDSFAISGWRNELRPNEPVPLPLGRHRMSPPFAATSYTEISGDTQFVRALFCFGYGPLALTDLKLGETPLSDYDEVEIELREGLPGDLPVTLYPRQVLEEAANVDLVRPLPRNDAGEITAGASIETPVSRFTAGDSTQAAVLLGFPSGLFRVNSKGEVRSGTVMVRIRQRLVGSLPWSTVETLNLSAKRRESFLRQHLWTLPTRGRWEIEITRMTDETTDTQVSDRCVLSAIQSIRPEYPINLDKPLALAAVRIRATYQLNGGLDNLNAVVSRIGPTWTGSTWVDAESRNPATAYLVALQGPSNPYPVGTAEIDWAGLADWYDYCVTKGLKYDRLHEAPESLAELLAAICAAGRAAPRHDGLRWGVVIDRPSTQVIDHVSPRNSADFGWQRSYFDPPHAFRVSFLDETNNHEPAERIVPWPGYTGPITLTESLEQSGKTDPAEIWREARRRMYELIHRPDTFTATQDGAARVATRGDLVMGSFDVLVRSQIAARVQSVTGLLVELDEAVEMLAGRSYAIRYRTALEATDVIGSSVVRRVAFTAGPDRAVMLLGAGPTPAPGGIVHFGELAQESVALKVKGIEAGEGFAARLIMVEAAPQIDALTDADVPPAWDGRVGADIGVVALAPAAPRISSARTGYDGTGAANGLELLLAPGLGSSAHVVAYRIDHRLVGAPSWTALTVPAAGGGTSIAGYVRDDVVELRALAIAADGTLGPLTSIITVTIGQTDASIPLALDGGAILVAGGLGRAVPTFVTSGDPAIVQVQLYRAATGVPLDRPVHAIGDPHAVTPSGTFSLIDGDATRVTQIANGGFDSGAVWSLAANWAIAAGKATHTTGAADTITQTMTLTAGKYYRFGFEVTGRTTGSVTPRLTGGTTQSGTARAANGAFTDRIQAVAGNTAIGFIATSDFNGAVDNVVVYTETSGCVAAGVYDYWLEPQNADDVPGPVAGPFAATII